MTVTSVLRWMRRQMAIRGNNERQQPGERQQSGGLQELFAWRIALWGRCNVSDDAFMYHILPYLISFKPTPMKSISFKPMKSTSTHKAILDKGGVWTLRQIHFGDAFVHLTSQGYITWGNYDEWSCEDDSVLEAIRKVGHIHTIAATKRAFAAVVGADRTVVVWGHPGEGGSINAPIHSVVDLQSTESGEFAALHDDGSVSIWGNHGTVRRLEVNARFIVAAKSFFAIALENGPVMLSDSSSDCCVPTPDLDPKWIVANDGAIAVVLVDGTAMTFGNPLFGGDGCFQEPLRNVKEVLTSCGAFCFLIKDEDQWQVRTGGDRNMGGICPHELTREELQGSELVLSMLARNPYGIAVTILRPSGLFDIVMWAGADRGATTFSRLQEVVAIASSGGAFAAIVKKDGRYQVIAWGDPQRGGVTPTWLPMDKDPVGIVGNYGSFTVLYIDGSVECWGDPECLEGFDGVRELIGEQKVESMEDICFAGKAWKVTTIAGRSLTWGAANCGGIGTDTVL